MSNGTMKEGAASDAEKAKRAAQKQGEDPSAPISEGADSKAAPTKESREAKKRQAQLAAHKRDTERNFQNIQQCLLTENLDLVKNYHRQHDDIFKYQTFRQINGESHKIINNLRGLSGFEEFLNVRTTVLSLLQPKIRLYKVVYEEGQRNPGQKGSPVPTQNPIYKEIKFSDNFGSEAASSASEYLKYEMKKPNWRNVGLQSFTLKQFGRSFGALEKNIQCEMVLYSKGLKDLLATSPGSDARYIDLLLFPPKAQIKTRDTSQPNPKYYQIKIYIGYSKPPAASISNIALTPSEREFLKNIEKFNFLVSLTMSDYNFNIGENGEVTSTIKFFGSISAATDISTDVFDNSMVVKEGTGTKIVPQGFNPAMSRTAASDVKALLGKIMTAKKNPDLAEDNLDNLGRSLLEMPLFRSLYKESFPGEEEIKANFQPSDVEAVLDTITSNEGVLALSAQLRRHGAGLKGEVFKSFMLQLLDGNRNKGDDTRLFAISVDKNSLDAALGVINQLTPKDKRKREEIKRETSNAIGLASQTVRIGRPKDISPVKKSVEAVEGQAQENVSDPGEEQTAQDGIQTVEGATKASLITSKTKGDRYDFYFLYVGDIIELAAKNAGMFSVMKDADPVFTAQSYNRKEHGTDYGLTNVRFLLGPLEYNGVDGKIKRINLAEFPVSFDLFRAWFLEKIVREDRSKMSFRKFLGSLIKSLVLPALGADCLRPIKLPNVSFQNLFMTLPGKQADSLASKSSPGRPTEELLPVEGKIDIDSPSFQQYARKIQTVIPHDSMIKNSYDYQLVQTSGYKKISSRSGNCKEDIEDGIYHFNIGSDKGLLKRMIFSKVSIAHQQERMSAIAIKEGANQLTQLAFTFNCDLDLIGNTLFMPGMMFYANPTFAGMGDPQEKGSVSHQLKLGGYFLILETELKITAGQFTSSVKAKYVGHGKIKNSDAAGGFTFIGDVHGPAG
tara:strand:+ start:2974 stop:5838 length:2865 start_codon:yes stop_codon:yes gene_type:complete